MCALVTGVQTCVLPICSAMSGTGAINQLAGVTLLNGDSAGFSGLTSVSGGALYVNNALGGDVAVATGGTLGGIGTIGGNVTVADGALNPGNLGAVPGTLTINGSLDLASTSTINVSRSEERRVGKAVVSKCRSRWSQCY